MRGLGLVLVGLGLTVMVAGLAYSGVTEWHPSMASAFWSFVVGAGIAVTGGMVHSKA